MKFLRNIVVLCTFIAGIGTAANLFAAENQLSNMGANASNTAQEALKKDAVCTRCHDESEPTPVLSIYQTKHGVKGDSRTPTCQSCHGESEKHLKGDPNVKGRAAPDVIFKKGTYAASDDSVRSGQCLACHKGNARSNWEGSQHESGKLACNSCHTIHAPVDKVRDKLTQTEVCFTCHKEQRAQTHRISTHPIDAGKVICSNCHNPHGSTGPKLLVKNSVNETCYTCHAEKRGPFLWEHGPVVDDCTNCHTPHGSTNAPLLKTRVPFLCQECHTGDHGSGINSAANLPGGNVVNVNGLNTTPIVNIPRGQTGGRACLNCHILIHGSNSPAGAKFQR